jgi:hypothetical protein
MSLNLYCSYFRKMIGKLNWHQEKNFLKIYFFILFKINKNTSHIYYYNDFKVIQINHQNLK